MFRGLELGVVFLQNILADLLLGLGLGEVFLRFSEYTGKHYGAEAGFMTMNLPAMVRFMKANGLLCFYGRVVDRVSGTYPRLKLVARST